MKVKVVFYSVVGLALSYLCGQVVQPNNKEHLTQGGSSLANRNERLKLIRLKARPITGDNHSAAKPNRGRKGSSMGRASAVAQEPSNDVFLKRKISLGGRAMLTENSGRNRGRVQNLKPWKPGQSGNPGGRPKNLLSDAYKTILREKVPGDAEGRTYAQVIALATVGEAIKGKINAASEIADRTEAKATQGVAVEGGRPILLLHDVPSPQHD